MNFFKEAKMSDKGLCFYHSVYEITRDFPTAGLDNPTPQESRVDPYSTKTRFMPFWADLSNNCLNSVHCHCDGPPVLVDLAAEQIGSLAVDHVTEAVVGGGEKGGFHNSGFIFEG